MPEPKSQKRKRNISPPPDCALDAGTPNTSHENMAGSFQPKDRPAEPCQAYCCRRGTKWVHYYHTLDCYINGPSEESLNTMGNWKPLLSEVKGWSRDIQQMGLAAWGDLDPNARRRLESWTPAARRFWESDFPAHRSGIVQAWIWHYLDDNLFSFATDAEEESLVKSSSKVWKYVRGLRRELDGLRACGGDYDDPIYRIQFSAWMRITEHLVRRGLGAEQPVEPAHLVSHFKQFLRQLVAGGEGKFLDDAHDGELDHLGDPHNPIDRVNEAIKRLLRDALDAQYFLHGMHGSYTLRFTPIGSDETFGFPFDEDWMQLANAVEVPTIRPHQPDKSLPPVQLVTEPMLVVSGLDGLNHGREFSLVTHMQVITPWTFGGPEAESHIRAGFEKGYELLPAEVQREWRIRAYKEARERLKMGMQDNNTSGTPVTGGQQSGKAPQTLRNDGNQCDKTPEIPAMDGPQGDSKPQLLEDDEEKGGNTPEALRNGGQQSDSTPRILGNDGEQDNNIPETPTMDDHQGNNTPCLPGSDGERGKNMPEALHDDDEQGEDTPETPDMNDHQGDDAPQTLENDSERGDSVPEALHNDGEQGDNTPEAPDMGDQKPESQTVANVG